MDVVRLDAHPLEPVQQRAAVVQQRVHDDARREGECDQVRHGVRRRQEERRVVVVRDWIEEVVACEHARDVVDLAEPVVGVVVGYGKVGQVPGLSGVRRTGS